ncbi:hypothetical protein [Poriferisphaera sp. WC338]|uniref:hypothetical protein n=1 Tax=Poriferisphaera sp. WC338 TaxID=3425129 RepID=UPI003D81A58C
MHETIRKKLTLILTAGAAMALTITTASATPTAFVGPDHWSIGDAGSTYQEWDTFTSTTSSAPDVGYNNAGNTTAPITTNTAVEKQATAPPGPGPSVAGSGNYYSFASDYNVIASITNATGSGSGTHVIMQVAAQNSATSIAILDDLGNAIAGIVNLRSDNMAQVFQYNFTPPPPAPQIPVPIYHYEDIHEFYLPNFTGDFQIVAAYDVHTSFDALRVDTKLTDTAFGITAIPEPAAASLLLFGSMLMLGKRRSV